MKKIELTGIQRGCVYDGQGIRTTLFLKGCSFACPWCCNPETLYSSPQLYFDYSKCVKEKGISSFLCRECILCGGSKPITDCPFGVAKNTTISYSIKELYDIILNDKNLLVSSKGGVTFSGGEPLLHIVDLMPLFILLKDEEIPCALETTLYKKDVDFSTLCYYVDEWIIDLKIQPENYKLDFDDVFLANLFYLRKTKSKLIFRLVFVESLDANIVIEKLKMYQIAELEIIKCHSLAETKYRMLGLAFHKYDPSSSAYNDFIALLIEAGFIVTKLSI